jgi:hypothetical protein
MLKNLHVITGIIFALTIFCLLQVVTGGLFYSAVSNDRHNFQNSGVLNAQQESLSDSVNTLVKTRVTVTRVAIRYLKNQRDPASWRRSINCWAPQATRWQKPKPITKSGRNCRRLRARRRH